MRKLNFRVWSLTEKCFIHNFFISNGFSQVWKINGEIDSLEVYPLADVVVQQFTELFDKNSLPIYEGDILTEFCLEDDEEPSFYEVIFDDGSFRLKNLYFLPIVNEVKSLKIVGNIFESPELI